MFSPRTWPGSRFAEPPVDKAAKRPILALDRSSFATSRAKDLSRLSSLMQAMRIANDWTRPYRDVMAVDPATGDRSAEVTLFQSNWLKITDRVQTGARAGWGPTRGGGDAAVVFLRSGLFECKTVCDYVLTESTHVKFYDAAHEYRFQRLRDGGESYTKFYPGEALMDEAFRGAGFQTSCGGDVHYQHLKLYRSLRNGDFDDLEVGDAALELLGDVASAFGARRESQPVNPALRRRLQAAQAYVAADPACDHRLSDVAAIAGCSEFHFARVFRLETGQSLRGYRRRLRLRLALKLISEGQDNLSAVALDSGFATHSHLTAAFRAAMGRTPSDARARIALGPRPTKRAS